MVPAVQSVCPLEAPYAPLMKALGASGRTKKTAAWNEVNECPHDDTTHYKRSNH